MGQNKVSLLLRCPLFIGWKHARVVVGVGEGVLFREVSSLLSSGVSSYRDRGSALG